MLYFFSILFPLFLFRLVNKASPQNKAQLGKMSSHSRSEPPNFAPISAISQAGLPVKFPPTVQAEIIVTEQSLASFP